MEILQSEQKKWINLYNNLLLNSNDTLKKEQSKGYCHVMMGLLIGNNYQGNLIIGRAPNGWHRYSLNTENLFKGPERIFNYPDKLTEIKNKYGTSRGFWKISEGIFKPLYGENWEQTIAYTNYCKLAYENPNNPQKSANPSYDLAKAQQTSCNYIIEAELDKTSPKNILIFTGCNTKKDFGLYTDPLMTHLLGEKWSNKAIAERQWGEGPQWGNAWLAKVFNYGNSKIFLSEHPDRKFEYDDNHIKVLSELLRLYGNP